MKRANRQLFWVLANQCALEIFGTGHRSSSNGDPRIIQQKWNLFICQHRLMTSTWPQADIMQILRHLVLWVAQINYWAAGGCISEHNIEIYGWRLRCPKAWTRWWTMENEWWNSNPKNQGAEDRMHSHQSLMMSKSPSSSVRLSFEVHVKDGREAHFRHVWMIDEYTLIPC